MIWVFAFFAVANCAVAERAWNRGRDEDGFWFALAVAAGTANFLAILASL